MRLLAHAAAHARNTRYERTTSRGAYHQARLRPRSSRTESIAQAVWKQAIPASSAAVVSQGASSNAVVATAIGVMIISAAKVFGFSERRIFAQRVCRSKVRAT